MVPIAVGLVYVELIDIGLVGSSREDHLPAVDPTDVDCCTITYTQIPGASTWFRTHIHRNGFVDVVRATTGAVMQVVDGAIRMQQINHQITNVRVNNRDGHTDRSGIGRTGHRDRTADAGRVVVRNV